MKRRSAILVCVSAALAGAMIWYLYGPRRVPPGQPPLARLNTAGLETLRADFNRDTGWTRIILLLSPT